MAKSHSLLCSCLRPLSYLYGGAVALRRYGYQKGWFRQFIPPRPTISVGNIVAGGTGKTPVTQFLAEAFSKTHRVAILSRGYRGKAEKRRHPSCLSDGKDLFLTAAESGDEPFMLARNLPNVLVYVGRKRRQSSLLAAMHGAELILLDDGMQHQALKRDFDVVTIDGHDPLGGGALLPSGWLREQPTALKRADLIIVNHLRDELHLAEVESMLRSYTDAPVIGANLSHEAWCNLDGVELVKKPQKIALFSAIAKPHHFQQAIESEGIEVVDHTIYRDHSPFSSARLEAIAQRAKAHGAQALVCTEKDAVKLPSELILPLPLYWIRSRLELLYGVAEWEVFLAKVLRTLNS